MILWYYWNFTGWIFSQKPTKKCALIEIRENEPEQLSWRIFQKNEMIVCSKSVVFLVTHHKQQSMLRKHKWHLTQWDKLFQIFQPFHYGCHCFHGVWYRHRFPEAAGWSVRQESWSYLQNQPLTSNSTLNQRYELIRWVQRFVLRT